MIERRADGIEIGPVIGGVIVSYAPWQWIFLVNLPIGLVLLPVVWLRIEESHGPYDRLDLRGVALSSIGLLALVMAERDLRRQTPVALRRSEVSPA